MWRVVNPQKSPGIVASCHNDCGVLVENAGSEETLRRASEFEEVSVLEEAEAEPPEVLLEQTPGSPQGLPEELLIPGSPDQAVQQVEVDEDHEDNEDNEQELKADDSTSCGSISKLESIMAAYILFRKKDRLSRNIWSISVLILFASALAAFVAWPYVLLPFASPHGGFWANWIYNFVAHPVANYIVARCVVGWFGRFLEDRSKDTPHYRNRIHRIVFLVPWIDSAFCLLVHMVSGAAGYFPVPMAVLTGCIPGLLCSLAVAYMLVPTEFKKDPAYQSYTRFVIFVSFIWCGSFASFVAYSWVFPLLSSTWQAVGMLLYHAFVHAATQSIIAFGRFQNISDDLIMEFQLLPGFLGLLFASSLLGKSKNVTVTLLMLGAEACKEAFLAARTILFSTSVTSGRASSSRISLQGVLSPSFWTRQQLQLSNFLLVVRSTRETCLQLRTCMAKLSETSKEEELQPSDVSRFLCDDEISLLNEASFRLRHLALLNLDEMLAPTIYVLFSLAMYSDTLDYNAKYIFSFKGQSHEEIVQGVSLNLFGLLLQLALYCATSLLVRGLLGINFLHFSSWSIYTDSMYWLSFFGALYIAWLTVLVEHAGHHPLFGLEMPW